MENENFLHKLSLGWRLALSTSIIVAIVMGSVSAFQMTRSIGEERRSHENLLKHSLSPLVMQLSNIEELHEALLAIETFHIAFVRSGHSNHHMIIEDENKNVIFSTTPESKLTSKNLFRVSVPYSSPSLSRGIGNITVFEDASIFQSQVSKKWLGWFQHMIITLGAIIIFLLIAIHIQVIKPLESLRLNVRKMQMGYWDDLVIPSGAWEIRWLAIRFQAMMFELRKTVRHLLEAERYSQEVMRIAEDEYKFDMQKLNHIDVKKENKTQTPSSIESELKRMCDRLEHLVPGNPDSEKIAKEIMEQYNISAKEIRNRDLKNRIENAIFRILEPGPYMDLNMKVQAINKEMTHWIKHVKNQIHDKIEAKMIPCLNIQYRIKHIAAIWNKMKEKNLEFDQVNDLIAFRIIVPTETDCYWVLGMIHDVYTPIIERFKDYIKAPKKNGYQSLHTCVRDKQGPVFEIQIRSMVMHNNAEIGNAAHWVYKLDSSTAIRHP